MAEPLSLTGAGVFMKVYLAPFLGLLLSSIAYALQEAKSKGWKGWLQLGSDIVIALASGNVMYSFLIIYSPTYALSLGFASSFLGPKGVQFFLKAVRSNIK